jgi:hypothetical protein
MSKDVRKIVIFRNQNGPVNKIFLESTVVDLFGKKWRYKIKVSKYATGIEYYDAWM